MNGHRRSISFALTLGWLVLTGALAMLGAPGVWSNQPPAAHAQSGFVRYVAPTGADGGGCTDPTSPCRTVQYAVNQAGDGDVIKGAAGVYTGVRNVPSLNTATFTATQVAVITKTLTIQGGYTTTNWTTPYPITQPATLDAQGQGRVLYIVGNISPTIEGLHITGGDAAGLGGTWWGMSAGGGVYVITATAILRNNQVSRNTAWYGGGLYLEHSPTILNDNVVTANTAEDGGGLCLSYSDAVIHGNTISTNTADWGGGLYLFDCVVTLSRNTIAANNGGYYGGGGLYMHGSTATLNENAIIANTARFGGGLSLSYSTATLGENAITANTAYACGGLRLTSSTATLSNNTVTGNTADYGGGLSLFRSAATLRGNTFTANAVTREGGGLYLEHSAATLSGNVVAANTANAGGGLFLHASPITATNNVVTDNQVVTAGSGLYIRASSPRLWHTTIARNTGGDGSGVYVTNWPDTSSTVVLTNTILVGHTVGIIVTAGNTVTLAATLWGTATWANGMDWGGAGEIVTGTRNTWGDPAFVNPDTGDYHIRPGSAALNAGVAAGVATDMDGEIRPDWCFPDLGADELITGMGCHYFYLPLIWRS